MRNGKRAAIDNITVEMIKVVTDTTVGSSRDIFRLIWEEERIPENWRTGVKWLHRVITYGVARASVIFWMLFLHSLLHSVLSNSFHVMSND